MRDTQLHDTKLKIFKSSADTNVNLSFNPVTHFKGRWYVREHLRVLHIDGAEIWGGGQSQIATLIRETKSLETTRHIDHYLASPRGSKLWMKVRSNVKDLFPLPRSAAISPWSMLMVARFCRRHHIHIIHAHCGKSHTFAYWLKRLFLKNVRLIVHRRIPAKIRPNMLSQIKFTSSLVNHFITVSKFIKSVLESGGVEANRITVIRSSKKPFASTPLDKQRAREALTRTSGLAAGGDFYVVSASRLVPDKGLFVLIEAFRRLTKEMPNARLFIAGEGELERDLKTAAKALTDSGQIVFLGFRKDVPELLLGADVFAIPSLSEGLGSTIVEAMMAKTVVIGSRVEGIPELIRHDQTGILVHPGNPDALYEALRMLAANASQRATLAEAALAWALRDFVPQIMAEKTCDVYRRVFAESQS
jgi:glycosyltransferase involved in cell wall biosynthesis